MGLWNQTEPLGVTLGLGRGQISSFCPLISIPLEHCWIIQDSYDCKWWKLIEIGFSHKKGGSGGDYLCISLRCPEVYLLSGLAKQRGSNDFIRTMSLTVGGSLLLGHHGSKKGPSSSIFIWTLDPSISETDSFPKS